MKDEKMEAGNVGISNMKKIKIKIKKTGDRIAQQSQRSRC